MIILESIKTAAALSRRFFIPRRRAALSSPRLGAANKSG
jgi:hypothetical protein